MSNSLNAVRRMPTFGPTAHFGLDTRKVAKGYFSCDGNDDHLQIQDAIDFVEDEGGGMTRGERGLYDFGGNILLPKKVSLVCDGREHGTTFSMSAVANCIEIDPEYVHAWYELGGFRIDMNNVAGHGIFSEQPSDFTFSKPYIHDIDIYDVDSTKYGMWLLDHFHTNIKRISIYTNGGGINISKKAAGRAANLGNSYWEDIHILLQGANGYGIFCESEASGFIMNLMEFHRVQIMGQPQGGPPAGTTGLYLRGVQNTAWYNLNIEDIHYGVHLHFNTARDSFFNHFYAPYIYSARTKGWFFEGAVHGTVINGGETFGGGTCTHLLHDTTASDGKENNFQHHKFFGTGLIYPGRKTNLHNMAWDTPLSQIGNPFGSVNGQNCIHTHQGGAAVPVSGTIYYARVMNYYVTVSGGTVSNIQLYDKAGNTIITGITSTIGLVVPRGYRLEVTWSSSPTVNVYPWGD